MNANEAIRWIHSRRYTGHRTDWKTRARCSRLLGEEPRAFSFLHIAGTNGKGSTAAMCAACLQKSGYVTGLYTSPYLENYRERIRVNGQCIPERRFCAACGRSWRRARHWTQAGISPTTFEIGTALAFWYFREAACRWRWWNAAGRAAGLHERHHPHRR